MSGVFADLMQVGHQFGRRPLCRHGLYCNCLGADEAVFAHVDRGRVKRGKRGCCAAGVADRAPGYGPLFLRDLPAEFGIAHWRRWYGLLPKPKRNSPVPKGRPSLKRRDASGRLSHFALMSTGHQRVSPFLKEVTPVHGQLCRTRAVRWLNPDPRRAHAFVHDDRLGLSGYETPKENRPCFLTHLRTTVRPKIYGA